VTLDGTAPVGEVPTHTNEWSAMFQVLTCLTSEHDRRLVALAVLVCLLASGVAISLLHRAQATRGRARLVWLSLDAAAGGCGIWATHFIAMLAYQPGVAAGYNLGLTTLSLIFAWLSGHLAKYKSVHNFDRWSAIISLDSGFLENK
jgi:NO-binding membrane sensor protein with MHYT domain